MVQAVIATTVTGLQGRGVANTAPTNNQALTWNGSAWAPAGPFLTAAGAPYIAENYVDNSGFIINQRGYSSGTALAAGAYGFDRWKAGTSGCTLTFTPSPSSTVVTIAAGTLQQVIEGISQINATYTLSWLGSATGRVNTGTYVASPISYTGAPNTNVTIEFQGGTLGQVQLQIGSQASLWQPQPPQVALARCQRFFFSSITGSFAEGGWTGAVPLNVFFSYILPGIMRAPPSLTLSQLNLTNCTGPIAQSSGVAAVAFYASVTAPGAWSVSFGLAASADL